MIEILRFILSLLGFILTIYSIYYIIFAFYSIKRRVPYDDHQAKTRFGIVIAARNEETVITDVVMSLKKLDYPKHLYDIYVVPNNCCDNTADKAKAAGAIVLDCQYPVSSKGEVLRHTFNQLMSVQYDYDAFCVFDADNVVDKNFLNEMNSAYISGIRIAQGYRAAKNPYDSWITSCYDIYFSLMNRFINQAKFNAGLSAYINGTGFMISTATLKHSSGWCTTTLSEDTEYCLLCMINDEKIAWVPNAITYDEQPLTLQQSMTQRRRWSSGALQLLSLYHKKLLQRINYNNFAQFVDGFVSLFAPIIQLASIVQLLLTILLVFLNKETNVLLYLFPIIASYITTVILALIILISEHKLNKQAIKGIMTFWLFVMSWTLINIQCLFKKTTLWHEIKHTQSINKLKVKQQDIKV